MTRAIEVLEDIRAAAEAVQSDETQAVGTMSPGDMIRQGDVMIVCLTGTKVKLGNGITDRQLAPGTSQGSRHVLEGGCEIFAAADKSALIRQIHKIAPATKALLSPDRDEPLIGPIVRTKGECEITHPEHGNWRVPGGETLAIVYQRAFSDQVRRQED